MNDASGYLDLSRISEPDRSLSATYMPRPIAGGMIGFHPRFPSADSRYMYPSADFTPDLRSDLMSDKITI